MDADQRVSGMNPQRKSQVLFSCKYVRSEGCKGQVLRYGAGVIEQVAIKAALSGSYPKAPGFAGG
jgi:hypothetical protein